MDLDDLLGPESVPSDKKKKKSSSGKDKQSEKAGKKDKDSKSVIAVETSLDVSSGIYNVPPRGREQNSSISLDLSDRHYAEIDSEIQGVEVAADRNKDAADNTSLGNSYPLVSASELPLRTNILQSANDLPLVPESNDANTNNNIGSRLDEEDHGDEDDGEDDAPFSAVSVVKACEKRVAGILRLSPRMPAAQTLAEKQLEQLRDQLTTAVGREKVLSQHLNEYKDEMVALLAKQREDAEALANAELRLCKSDVYRLWTQQFSDLDQDGRGVAILQSYLEEKVEGVLQNAENLLGRLDSNDQVCNRLID